MYIKTCSTYVMYGCHMCPIHRSICIFQNTWRVCSKTNIEWVIFESEDEWCKMYNVLAHMFDALYARTFVSYVT